MNRRKRMVIPGANGQAAAGKPGAACCSHQRLTDDEYAHRLAVERSHDPAVPMISPEWVIAGRVAAYMQAESEHEPIGNKTPIYVLQDFGMSAELVAKLKSLNAHCIGSAVGLSRPAPCGSSKTACAKREQWTRRRSRLTDEDVAQFAAALDKARSANNGVPTDE